MSEVEIEPVGLTPLEAHEHVLRFAAARGENGLRLALHAAVPKVLRPEIVHLLRLNFVPDSLDDPALEADVLFASFCEDLGHGYFKFDDNARGRLLTHLDPAYADQSPLRSRQVAAFLLAYIEQQLQGVSSSQDLVRAEYLEVERWVALAFLSPEAAACQLAIAVRESCEPGRIAARFRIGGLTSALSTPLSQHQPLLAFAAGLEALQRGDASRGRELLEEFADRDLEIAGVTLPSARRVLDDWRDASVEAGQESATGMIEGQVVDASGAFIPGVVVEVSSVDRGLAGRSVTNVHGRFSLEMLPDKYRLTFSLTGFHTFVADAVLAAGETVSLSIEMQIELSREAMPSREADTRDVVFLSCHHRDREWAEALRLRFDQLSALGLDVWSADRMSPREGWQEALNAAIERARMAIVLLSPDYLQSEALHAELAALVSRAERDNLWLTWICVRACDWGATQLANWQAAHSPSEPLSDLRRSQRERVLTAITDRISTQLQESRTRPRATASADPALPRSGRIGICYRRESARGHADRLYDWLSRDFGGQVWRDMESIPLGVDFRVSLEAAIGSALALLVIIGPDWLEARDADGRRRLDNSDDFVRYEIAAALKRGIRVVPILVGGGTMPYESQLPPDIADIARRNAMAISHETWDSDYKRLRDELRRLAREGGETHFDRPTESADEVHDADEMPDGAIYISCAEEDQGVADLIREALEGAGLPAWPREPRLTARRDRMDDIERDIARCALFIAVISKSWSKVVEGLFWREVSVAIQRSQRFSASSRFLIPVVIDDMPPNDPNIPTQLRDLQWIRFDRNDTNRVVRIVRDLYRNNRIGDSPL